MCGFRSSPPAISRISVLAGGVRSEAQELIRRRVGLRRVELVHREVLSDAIVWRIIIVVLIATMEDLTEKGFH